MAQDGTTCNGPTDIDEQKVSTFRSFNIYVYSDLRSDITSTIQTQIDAAVQSVSTNTITIFLNQFQTTLLAASLFTSFSGMTLGTSPTFSIPVILQSNIASSTFSWMATGSNGLSGFPASGTGDIPSMQIFNTFSRTG